MTPRPGLRAGAFPLTDHQPHHQPPTTETMNANHPTTPAPAPTEREQRLAAELARFDEATLATPCYDLDAEELLRELADEAGWSSAKTFLNDAGMWSATLREAITYLVNDLYTLDDEIYDSKEELQDAIDHQPVAIRVTDVRVGRHESTVTICDVDREGRTDGIEDVCVSHYAPDSEEEVVEAIEAKLQSIAESRGIELEWSLDLRIRGLTGRQTPRPDTRLEVPDDFNSPSRCVHCDAPIDREGRYLPPGN